MVPVTSGSVLDVVYASETGNGEDLADRVARHAADDAAVPVRIRSIDRVGIDQLATIRDAVFIISTTGSGNVPYDAEELWAKLLADDAPTLENLRFGVLALGDSTYADFCTAGIELDDRLAELGAQRSVDIITCDFNYEEPASRWLRDAVQIFAADLTDGATAGQSADAPAADEQVPQRPLGQVVLPSAHGPERHDAVLVGAKTLSSADADREVVHYTLELPPEGREGWQPGDSFDLSQPNDPGLVAAVLDQLGIAADHQVPVWRDRDNGATPLAATATDLLTEHFELRLLPRALFESIAERTGDARLTRMLTARDGAFEAWREGHDLLSVLRAFPQAQLEIMDILPRLRPLQGRAYSVASSPLVDRSHVDLTVRTIRYQKDGRTLSGTVSGALADRAAPGARIPLRLRPAPAFRLPSDPAADIVMVGPGVGIAPFRGFLQHREARGDSGRSWLICGIRDLDRDFLYGDELTRWQDRGVLTRLDVATSRSRTGAEYVQHRIASRGEELFRWLAVGATLYVCGDARAMAPAVRLAVRAAATRSLGSTLAADSWLASLDAEGRYLQDVY